MYTARADTTHKIVQPVSSVIPIPIIVCLVSGRSKNDIWVQKLGLEKPAANAGLPNQISFEFYIDEAIL